MHHKTLWHLSICKNGSKWKSGKAGFTTDCISNWQSLELLRLLPKRGSTPKGHIPMLKWHLGDSPMAYNCHILVYSLQLNSLNTLILWHPLHNRNGFGFLCIIHTCIFFNINNDIAAICDQLVENILLYHSFLSICTVWFY